MSKKTSSVKKDDDSTFVITKVLAKNFYSYPEFNVDLTDMTIISGEDNGSGKTSIIQAIAYALTGKLIQMTMGEIKDTDVIRDGETEMTVQIEGIMEGVPITITRSRSTTGSATGSKHCEMVIHHPSGDRILDSDETKQELANLITVEELEELVYVNGHHINTLIEGTPKARSDLLDKMFGFTAISNVFNKLQPNMFRDQIAEKTAAIDYANTRMATITRTIHDLSIKQTLVDDLAEKKKSASVLRDEITAITAQLRPLELLREQWEKIQKQLTEMDRTSLIVSHDIDKALTTITTLNTAIASAEAKSADVLRPDESIPIAIARLEEEMADLAQKRDEVTKNLDYYKYVPEIRARLIAKLDQSEREVCPICKTTVDSVGMQLISADDEVVHHEDQLEQIRRAMAVIDAKRRVLEESHAIITDHTNRIEVLTADIVQKKKQVELISTRRKTITPSTESKSTELTDLRIAIGKKETELLMIQKEITGLEGKITKLTAVEGDTTAITQIQSEIQSLTEERDVLVKRQEAMQRMRAGFDEMISRVRKNMIARVNPTINHWIKVLLPYAPTDVPPLDYQLYVKATASGVRYDQDVYRFQKPVDFTTLSTGQQAICALALILAISDVSYHRLGLIIFDELHTSGIDANVTKRIIKNIVKICKEIRVIFIDRRRDIIADLTETATKDKINVLQYEAALNREDHTSKITPIL